MEIEIQSGDLVLPSEIVEEILSRVAVKAVLRFRCVSKSWQYMIGSERFIRKHMKNSSRFAMVASSNKFRIWRCPLASLLSKEPEFEDLKYNVYPSGCLNLTLVGCCDGLVCLLYNAKEFILWNPSTRMSRRLPPLPTTAEGFSQSEGFGYDESSGDYKVVTLIDFFRPQYSGICSVYSSKSRSWKTAKGGSYFNIVGQGKYVGGKLHWLPCPRKDVKNIISFDMSREASGVVEIPHKLVEEEFEGKLWKYGECLSLLCYYPARIDVWVMKEESNWHKLLTVDNAYFDTCKYPGLNYLFYINGCRNGGGGGGGGGEIIFFEKENWCFKIYYPDGCSKRIGNYKYFEADIYSESLVQL